MANHPYKTAPASSFWRQAVATPAMADVDPVLAGKFKVAPTDKVATAGSCFAQHLARHIAAAGFSYLVTERAHSMFDPAMAADYNYGTFTARFGNVYTTRQLLQLLHRAYGLFIPAQSEWIEADGTWIDPFRPQIQPGGFENGAEYRADRQAHFAAIRRMVEELDVFVFTLGLTEAWVDRRDGAVFPVCPGVSGGTFDPDLHAFVNFRLHEVVADLQEALQFIRERNKNCKIVLTVSPVPLVATADDRHVLVATTYSKSCLRVACEEVVATVPDATYFPSYEIITGLYTHGAYFADDLRSVTEAGVEHVMRLFLRHYTDYTGATGSAAATTPGDAGADARLLAEASRVIATHCDEEALGRP